MQGRYEEPLLYVTAVAKVNGHFIQLAQNITS